LLHPCWWWRLRGRLRGHDTPVYQADYHGDDDYAARAKEKSCPTGRI
jgi:hypothetical protein